MASSNTTVKGSKRLLIRDGVQQRYPDVLTPAALDALEALAGFNRERQHLMHARIARRIRRFNEGQRIAFLYPAEQIADSGISVQQARAGQFDGSEIPHDLQRQWIQGTGPATKPRATVADGIRNVAYALLSGADGWMFDGEDALGQVDTMSLDNQRNLMLALAFKEPFPKVAESVAAEMNAWSQTFFGRRIVADWKKQLDFTTRIFRPRGLHLDDRHVCDANGSGFSAAIVDAALYVAGNHHTLRSQGRSIVLYLPKIQTAEEAALWNRMLAALEQHLGLPVGTV
jgi:malate synthase